MSELSPIVLLNTVNSAVDFGRRYELAGHNARFAAIVAYSFVAILVLAENGHKVTEGKAALAAVMYGHTGPIRDLNGGQRKNIGAAFELAGSAAVASAIRAHGYTSLAVETAVTELSRNGKMTIDAVTAKPAPAKKAGAVKTSKDKALSAVGAVDHTDVDTLSALAVAAVSR